MDTPLTKQELFNMIDTMISRIGVTDVDYSLNSVLKSMVGILPYKVYTALLLQSGSGAPIPTILQNNIGNISWTRDSGGLYFGTLSGAFNTSKTWLIAGSADPAGTSSQLIRIDNNTIALTTTADNFKVPIKIEIHP